MKEFCKKYGITETSAKALVRDGWVTCSLPQYEEIIIHYRKSGSMQKTAEHFGKSKSDIWNIVHRYG